MPSDSFIDADGLGPHDCQLADAVPELGCEVEQVRLGWCVLLGGHVLVDG